MSNFVPEGWRICNVDEFAKTSSGGTPNTQVPEYWSTGTVPWMSSGEVHKKRIKYVDQFISELGFKNSSAKLFPAKTILIALAGQGKTRGTVAISEVELTTNQSIAGVIVTDKTVFPDFVFHNLDSRYNELRSASGGSGRAGLNLSIIGEQELLLPPLPEQQKIATILSSVDGVIEKTRAQIDKLKDLKTGMMHELLTKGIGHTEFKDSPVGRIPISWKVVDLGGFCNIQNGYAFKSEDFASVGIPLIRISNIKNDQVSVKNDIYINNTTIPDRFCASFGDSLIAMSGATTGKTGCYRGRQKVYINQRVGKFVAKKNLATNAWIRHIVRSNKFLDAVLIDAVGGAQPNISSSQLEAIICALPPIAEQAQIADILDSIDLKHDVEISKLSELVNLKKALMQDLLTGKVRVNLTDKESAVV